MSASELEAFAAQAGFQAVATELAGTSPNIAAFARSFGSFRLVAVDVQRAVALQWATAPNSINLSFYCGGSRLLLEGRKRPSPSIIIYSQPTAGIRWTGQLLPPAEDTHPRWAYNVTIPLAAGLSIGLTNKFLESSWSECILDSEIARAFSIWASTQASAPPPSNPQLEMRQLLNWIQRLVAPLVSTGAQPVPLSDYSKIIFAVEKEIARLDRPVSVGELARDLDVSVRTMQRAFNSVFGVGVKRFIRLRQLYRARVLLRSGKYSVADAAESVGISHLSRFSRAYFQFFGERPSRTSVIHRSRILAH
jgi:AraC-like DNA-binding protein